MTAVCFNGCSFTVGEGFKLEHRNQYIYDHIVSKKYNFTRTNIATSGASNYKIFLSSAQAIMSKQYDIVFTQWSALNRLWLSPGPDSVFFVNDQKYSEFNYRNIHISQKEKLNLQNILLILNHDYQNILDLIDYCNILDQLSKINNTKSFYINGLVPWESDLDHAINYNNLTQSLGTYSKDILDFTNRNNEEIIKYFVKLQTKFKDIDKSKWVNLFESMQSFATDVGLEGHHPGPNSHREMADRIINFLETK